MFTVALLSMAGAPALGAEPLAAIRADIAEPPPVLLGLDELSAISGGAAVTVDVLSSQSLSATNSGNSIVAGSVRSGDVSFSENALSGFSGVGNFVINTGANNNLQGSISVNVVSTP